MLDIKFIRENKDLIKKNSSNRLSTVDIDHLLSLDQEKRDLTVKIEALRAERNEVSKKKPAEADIKKMKQTGEEIKELESKLLPVEEGLNSLLLSVPNLTHPDVVVSKNEEDNVVLEKGETKTFDFPALDHVQLAEKLDLIDFERGARLAGAKFYYLKNEAVFLEQALIQYALEVATKHGYTPFITPDLAKREILAKMGYNPRGESTQIYNIENSDLSLIGTAEIAMGGLHADEVLEKSSLPRKYVAISHCFRTEAGSYSKYAKGIFRVHQFTKVEMFVYCVKEEAEKYQKEILSIEKEIFDGLDVPYQVVDHCTADLGAPSFRTFDLEAWMPGKPNKDESLGDWAEITSVSNCTDYQSRALNIKYKDEEGRKELAYMINGTAIAMPRALISILENHQDAEGNVTMPSVLKKYLPFEKIKVKNN